MCSVYQDCDSAARKYQWQIQDVKKGEGARSFGSLPPRFFGYIFAILGDFLKNLAAATEYP